MLVRTVLLPIFLMFVTLLPHYAYSYCIYNKMTEDTTLRVQQVNGQQSKSKSFGGFKHDKISFGSKECCPYTSPNCSEKMTKDATVTFFISYQDKSGSGLIPSRKVSCPAGGYVVAKGKPDDITYESFDADHKLVGTLWARE